MSQHKTVTTTDDEADNPANPLNLKWEVANKFGEHKVGDNVFVIAMDDHHDRAWIILKEVPPTLAQHIAFVHNKEIEDVPL